MRVSFNLPKFNYSNKKQTTGLNGYRENQQVQNSELYSKYKNHNSDISFCRFGFPKDPIYITDDDFICKHGGYGTIEEFTDSLLTRNKNDYGKKYQYPIFFAAERPKIIRAVVDKYKENEEYKDEYHRLMKGTGKTPFHFANSKTLPIMLEPYDENNKDDLKKLSECLTKTDGTIMPMNNIVQSKDMTRMIVDKYKMHKDNYFSLMRMINGNSGFKTLNYATAETLPILLEPYGKEDLDELTARLTDKDNIWSRMPMENYKDSPACLRAVMDKYKGSIEKYVKLMETIVMPGVSA